MTAWLEIENEVFRALGSGFSLIKQTDYENNRGRYFDKLMFESRDMEIDIIIDRRTEYISSSLEFKYSDGKRSDKIMTSVAKEILNDKDSAFSDFNFICIDKSKSLKLKVKNEILCIKAILNYIETKGISPQSLEYFYFGYNCGAMKAVELR